jgi:hypothetical protein
MSNVNTITGSSGNDTLSDTVTLTSAEVVSVSLGDGNDALVLTLSTSESLTSTVSVFGGNGNDSLTVVDDFTGSAYVHYLSGGAGADTIVGAASGIDVIQISLANDLQSGTTLALADRVTSGFQTATDKIDLFGGTLVNAGGDSLTLSAASGTTLTTNGFTVATGAASVFADLTGSNQSLNLLLVTDAVEGSFTDETSVAAGVTLITGTIGASGSAAVGTKAVIVLNDDSDNAAIFLYTEAGTSGIQSTELKLIGVVTGSGDLSAANFI